MYRNLMENSIDAVYLLSRTGKILHVNLAACEMLGYSGDELLQLTIDDVDVNYPSKRFIEFWNNKPEGTTVLFETIHRHKDGREIPVEVNGIFFMLDGKKLLFGVSRDITERAGKEEALKRSEEKYRLLFDYSNDAIFVHEIGEDNLPGNNIEVNRQACELLQYSREELLAMSARDVVPEDQAASMLPLARELINRKHLVFETENIRRDGEAVPVEVSAYWYQEDGKQFAVAGVRDISERRKREKLLAKYRSLLESSQELANLGSWEWDIVNDRWLFSEQWEKIHGISGDSVSTSELLKIAHPDDAPYIEQAFSDAKAEGKPYDIQHRIIRADTNEIRYIHSLGRVEYSRETKCPARMIGTAQDITERKQAEERLAKQNAELRLKENAIRTALSGIAFNDMQGEVFFVNNSLATMFGYETPDDVYGKTVFDAHPEVEHETLYGILEILKTEGSCKAKLKAKKKNGELFDVQLAANLVSDEDGNEICIMVSFEDITEHTQAEEKIRRQLAEKETLLKEVHHRIKNNMAQVESLLSIQADSANSAEVKSALHEATARVRSTRTLYEKLLMGERYEEVSMRDYLEDLIDSLADVYNERPGVIVERKILDFTLSPKKAIPVGIIINELLTNVFKYAFTGRDGGHVSIQLDATETRATLTITDDGVGVDRRADANKSPGFGLTLVAMLAEQLEGTLSIESDHGTRSVVEFEI
jgi:PAS domain S-box-containing protein